MQRLLAKDMLRQQPKITVNIPWTYGTKNAAVYGDWRYGSDIWVGTSGSALGAGSPNCWFTFTFTKPKPAGLYRFSTSVYTDVNFYNGMNATPETQCYFTFEDGTTQRF